jgi:hypothetical protein
MSQDLLQAQGVDRGGGSGFPLTLNWTDWDDAQHRIVYTLENMPSGGFEILWRRHYIDSSLDSTTKVAEYIDPDPAETSCNWDGGTLIFTVTANVGGQSETRIYEVMPRSSSQ